MIEKMQELIKFLNEKTIEYDNGIPSISDKEWDNKYFELYKLEKEYGALPNSPTQIINYNSVNKLEKVNHNHLMLSLDKTKSIKDIQSFASNNEMIAMSKLDGLTCSLKYSNGKLISAETRGNGKIGENIFHNILIIKNVPKYINFKEDLVIDGEIICDITTFENKFKNIYKNPRNYAAGAIRRLDARENFDCGLSFVAWDIISGIEVDTLSKKLEYLKSLYFDVCPYIVSSNVTEEVINNIKEQSANYPIDGVVFKYNPCEIYKEAGRTEHHFKGGLAYKFYDELYDSQMKDIEWSLSRNGVLTPVAIFEPVEIEGSVVERANLHNISVFKNTLGDYSYIGQKVKIAKMNMIIPKILEADKKTLDKIKKEQLTIINDFNKNVTCPVCGGKTSIHLSESGVEILMCDNPKCEGKLANIIDHYCSKKAMDIRGLSIQTIDKLIDKGWLNDITDIYKLKDHKEEWSSIPGFGNKSVSNILSAIEDSKSCFLENFIVAIGIPLIGEKASKEIVKCYKTWKDFRSAVGKEWSNLEGFGPEMERALNYFDYTLADEISSLLIFKENIEENAGTALEGTIWCITGKSSLGSRDKVKAILEKNGAKVVSSVTSKTTHLLANQEENTAKYNNAVKYKIPIVNDEELSKICIL